MNKSLHHQAYTDMVLLARKWEIKYLLDILSIRLFILGLFRYHSDKLNCFHMCRYELNTFLSVKWATMASFS